MRGWLALLLVSAVSLAYCPSAMQAKAEVPTLQIVSVPDDLAVGAEYGLTLVGSARPEAGRFVSFVLSTSGQKF